jgi:hypothetical protein
VFFLTAKAHTMSGPLIVSVQAGQFHYMAREVVYSPQHAAEALQRVNFAGTSSVDPLGAPDLVEAIRVMGEAQEALQRAMAAVVTWVGTR